MDSPLIIQNALPFKTAYGPKLSQAVTGLDCSADHPYGRTKQAFRDESNINNIMQKFIKTGTLEFTNKNQPRYGDVTGADFQLFNNIIAAANTMFAEMPAALRNRFENDPAKFLDFVQNENNRAEATELGLLKPVQASEAQAQAQALSPSHREDGSATHAPLRATDGTYREHTRKEKREEARAQKASDDADK